MHTTSVSNKASIFHLYLKGRLHVLPFIIYSNSLGVTQAVGLVPVVCCVYLLFSLNLDKFVVELIKSELN